MSQTTVKGCCPGGTPSFIIRLLPGRRSYDWRGELLHAWSGETRAFTSFLEMVLLIQDWLTREGIPTPGNKLRSWESEAISDQLAGDY